MQWKVTGSISSFVQRAGRAARGRDRDGLVVLLAEQSVYSTILDEHGRRPAKFKFQKGKKSPKNKPTAPNRQQSATEATKARKVYSILRGSQRGSTDKTKDVIHSPDRAALNKEAEDEGLYTLVQAGSCRRQILTEVYKNKSSCESFIVINWGTFSPFVKRPRCRVAIYAAPRC